MMFLLSSCVNQLVAADQKTTYWTSWTLLPLKASLSSLPVVNRGWYNYLFTVPVHFNYIYLMSFHYSVCLSFHSWLKCLSCSSSYACFSFPFSLSVLLSDICGLLIISGDRAVWNYWKAAGELQCDWSAVCVSSDVWAEVYLSLMLLLSIRAAGSMSSDVNSPYLWRLVWY